MEPSPKFFCSSIPYGLLMLFNPFRRTGRRSGIVWLAGTGWVVVLRPQFRSGRRWGWFNWDCVSMETREGMISVVFKELILFVVIGGMVKHRKGAKCRRVGRFKWIMEGLFLIFSEWAPVDIIKIGFSLDVGMKRSNRGGRFCII